LKTESGRKILNSSSVPQESCVFCKIIRGELPSSKVFEDENYVAFLDINPFSRGHTLVCPKAHGETLWDMEEEEIGGLFATASRVSRAVMAATDADGFRILQNNGEAANQVVGHVHVHVIPVAMEDRTTVMTRKRIEKDDMDALAKKIRDADTG